MLYMHGGASQLETFDPKPGRETGGPTRAITTAVDGLQLGEHLPSLAARAERLAVLRSVTAREGNHDRARYLMHTGQPPQGGAVHPGLAALVSELHAPGDLPAAIAIGNPTQGPGIAGIRHGALTIRKPSDSIRNLVPSSNIDASRQADRAGLTAALQRGFADGRSGALVQAHDSLRERALALAGSARLDAFDLDRESAQTRARFGESDFGQGCLLARRLVEAGVPFVEVGMRGWDTHEDHFARTATLCRDLDRGMSALLDDLRSNGALDHTLVLWLGDFGRTPVINARGGRDHFPRASSVVLAGAGIPGGTVVGATDADGREVTADPITVPDLFRTVAVRLGIDPEGVRMSESGRPITTVDGGKAIAALA
ncbi:MAG: DUF1501 domain-containing protein [Deltaproteobacteria bacterium]|nr:DUF1501 domain-containing protein [Nannocystaceae bacterium]